MKEKERNEINDLSKGRKTYANYLPWNKDRLIIYSKMNKYIDNYVRKCYILKTYLLLHVKFYHEAFIY